MSRASLFTYHLIATIVPIINLKMLKVEDCRLRKWSENFLKHANSIFFRLDQRVLPRKLVIARQPMKRVR